MGVGVSEAKSRGFMVAGIVLFIAFTLVVLAALDLADTSFAYYNSIASGIGINTNILGVSPYEIVYAILATLASVIIVVTVLFFGRSIREKGGA